jgi:hypothetical protein
MRLPAPNLRGQSRAITPGIPLLGYLEDAHALLQFDMGKPTINGASRRLQDPFSFLSRSSPLCISERGVGVCFVVR